MENKMLRIKQKFQELINDRYNEIKMMQRKNEEIKMMMFELFEECCDNPNIHKVNEKGCKSYYTCLNCHTKF